jgi:hypothetical protein
MGGCPGLPATWWALARQGRLHRPRSCSCRRQRTIALH